MSAFLATEWETLQGQLALLVANLPPGERVMERAVLLLVLDKVMDARTHKTETRQEITT